jgi:hypothetical protein
MRQKIIIAIFVLLLGACATNHGVSEQIQMKATQQAHVFRELTDGRLVPGYDKLIIRATMKTVKAGFDPFVFKTPLAGKPAYPFVFNIGGQGVTWLARGIPDIQKKFVDGKRNPEGGEGIKYYLEKEIILKPGTYRIYIGMPEEKIQKEITITLTTGKTTVLEFKPLYFTGRFVRTTGSFYNGLRDFEIFHDGRKIADRSKE